MLAMREWKMMHHQPPAVLRDNAAANGGQGGSGPRDAVAGDLVAMVVYVKEGSVVEISFPYQFLMMPDDATCMMMTTITARRFNTTVPVVKDGKLVTDEVGETRR